MKPILSLALVLFLSSLTLAADANPYLGAWDLTIPGGYAGWLGVSESNGQLSSRLLWGWGSVEKVELTQLQGDTLILIRHSRDNQKNIITETITATRNGDTLNLTTAKKRADGTEFDKATFTGKRQPPMPPAPDLSKVKFGRPMELFNGNNLAGWGLTDPNADSGWTIRGGNLVNNPVQEKGKPHKNYGNLRTDREFGDFNLTLEAMLPKGGNSGVYLRGIYEIQVADTYGRPLDPHNMGALYSRITPSESAEKPAGEWQTLDITLVDQHVTVILNGKKIIDNQPAEGCTGGALWSDPTKPGPIYLQGDHTGVSYRNLRLRPVER